MDIKKVWSDKTWSEPIKTEGSMKTETDIQALIIRTTAWLEDGKHILENFIRTMSFDILKCKNKKELNNLGGKFLDDCYKGNKFIEIIDGMVGEYLFKTLSRLIFGVNYYDKMVKLAEKYCIEKE